MAIKEKKTETKSKLLELLTTDYRWENILLGIVSILGIILGLMIITGLGPLQISSNFPVLGTEPWGKIFAWTILAIALFGLFLVLYPFVVPAIPEIRKISWPRGKDYWVNVVRTVIFTTLITTLIVFFDAIIKLVILKGNLMAIELKKDYSNEFRWYTIQTYSGSEIQAKADLETRISSFHMAEYIKRVLAPTEEIIEKKKNGTEKKVTKMLFPGYIFVEMKMTQDSWFIVRNTPHITGLLGSSGKGTLPVPIPKREIDQILSRYGEFEKTSYDHLKGQVGKITSGSYTGQKCTVISYTSNKNSVTLHVVIEMAFFGDVDTEIDISEFSLLADVE